MTEPAHNAEYERPCEMCGGTPCVWPERYEAARQAGHTPLGAAAETPLGSLPGRTRRRLQGVIRDVLEMAVPAENGGYVAQFGPVTYARLVEFAGDQIDGYPSPRDVVAEAEAGEASDYG